MRDRVSMSDVDLPGGGHSPFGSDTHVPLPKLSLDPQLGVILTKYQTLI